MFFLSGVKYIPEKTIYAFLFYVYECLPECILIFAEKWRDYQIPYQWNFISLCATVWVLGTDPGSTARAALLTTETSLKPLKRKTNYWKLSKLNFMSDLEEIKIICVRETSLVKSRNQKLHESSLLHKAKKKYGEVYHKLSL